VLRNAHKTPYISGLHTIVLKSKDNSLDNSYKEFCFHTQEIKSQFKFYAVGTKVSGISKTNIAKIYVPVPSGREQILIAAVLGEVEALLEGLEKIITKKRAIKQGAMQELLTGKRRLPGFGSAGNGKFKR
jgi:type I restriction enzyme S subunit